MKKFQFTPVEKIVGPAIAEVLPKDGKPWYKTRHLIQLNLLLLIPLISSATGGYDGSLMNGLQSLDEWKNKYGDPTGTWLGFINAAQNIGAAAVAFFSGWLVDRFGRKISLGIGLVLILIATAIQSCAIDIGQLIAARFILGIGGLIAAQPSPMLIAELAYPAHRGKVTALYNTFYYLGAILASWACYGTNGRGDDWGWRVPTLLQAGYPLIQIIFLYWVPESPRWLVSKNRISEARDILVKYHAGGDENSALVDVEMSEIVEALDVENESKAVQWRDLFSTPGNRKRTYISVTLAVSAQWCGNAIISYYFTLVLNTIGITSSSEQTLINGLLQIFNFIAAVFAALVVDLFGRRPLFLWSTSGMLVSYVIWTALSAIFNERGGKSYGRGVLAFIFIFFFHYDVAFTPLVVSYPTEIYPYHLRAKGLSLSFFVTYGALIIGSFCNSIAMTAIGWKYYILFCCLLVVIVINVYFCYPETKGHSLEEIAEIFDGPSRAIDIERNDEKQSIEHVEFNETAST
ncbi:hypothetical protein CANARDRAFT_30434 [[Candida] arabinofermentans NRRL YB-2248]|uniref:Major facilitator superfamily (MFS) profile domain-containing protein n=1 Tax=[Candida] arabinofermentans NRRL YB-2248 TaxID=983967 RepID=A0A1E4STZ7_9ASCO|nr:hypothetical protein CANARDRAFT_30434 [[Candida] arabinofermentans NRRL YB-2248]